MDTQRRFFADDASSSELVTLPGEAYWGARVGAAASFAATHVQGLETLDVRCDEAAGRSLLVAAAADVVVLDRGVGEGATTEFPFPDDCFDAVVALDVVGHEPAPREFVSECIRVLRTSGTLVLSAPNRHMAPRNTSQRFELGTRELTALLSSAFDRVEVAGVFHGPRLIRVERVHRASVPERLVAEAAPDWPRWVSRVAARTTPGDFRVSSRDVASALDLVAVASR